MSDKPNNQKKLFNLISELSGQANILTVPKVYIRAMGSIDGGLLLSQMIYWSDKGKREDGYFYKTYAEWEDETTLSKYEVSKNVAIMVSAGFLQTIIKKANGAPTVHYKFSIDEFQQWIVKKLDNGIDSFLTIDSEETSQSLTETTSETTPETTTDNDNKEQPLEFLEFPPIDPEFGKVSAALLSTGLILNQFTSDDVKALYADCKPPAGETASQWFEYALKKASENQSLKLNYVTGIVRGIITSGSLAAHKLARQNAKNQQESKANGQYRGNSAAGSGKGKAKRGRISITAEEWAAELATL